MKLPFDANSFQQFTLSQFDLWVTTHNPATIEVTDRQYSWLCNLVRFCPRSYGINGAQPIPFLFVDAPENQTKV